MEARIAHLEQQLKLKYEVLKAALVDHKQRRTRVESADDNRTQQIAIKAALGSAQLSDTEMGREN